MSDNIALHRGLLRCEFRKIIPCFNPAEAELEKHSNLGAGQHPANKRLYSSPARYCTYLDCSVRATRCSLLAHLHGLDHWSFHISLPWPGLDTKKKRRTGPSEPPVHSQLSLFSTHLPLSSLACPFIHSAHSRPPHLRLLGRLSLLLTLTFPHFSRSFAPKPPFVSRASCALRRLSVAQAQLVYCFSIRGFSTARARPNETAARCC